MNNVDIANSTQEAMEAEKKRIAEEIAKIPMEKKIKFLNWVNELIAEEDSGEEVDK